MALEPYPDVIAVDANFIAGERQFVIVLAGASLQVVGVTVPGTDDFVAGLFAFMDRSPCMRTLSLRRDDAITDAKQRDAVTIERGMQPAAVGQGTQRTGLAKRLLDSAHRALNLTGSVFGPRAK